LRPISYEETASFLVYVKDAYTREIVTDAGLGEAEARAKPERDFSMLVSDGRPVAGQQLFWVEEAETNERVGACLAGRA
jgi:hypothetical protein